MVQILIRLDRSLTLLANRTSYWRGVAPFFSAVSFLGDGKFWYLLMLWLPCVYGVDGLRISAHMLAVGAVTLACYKAIKRLTRRPRPAESHPGLRLVTMPLDQYSFPSGHTMHAVAFTTVAVAYCPALLVPLVCFSALIGLSRMVLGLHYPTDVILGTGLGFAIGKVGLLAIGS